MARARAVEPRLFAAPGARARDGVRSVDGVAREASGETRRSEVGAAGRARRVDSAATLASTIVV
jgi:hypothetical protein